MRSIEKILAQQDELGGVTWAAEERERAQTLLKKQKRKLRGNATRQLQKYVKLSRFKVVEAYLGIHQGIATAILVRQSARDSWVFSSCLLDLYCLGLKDGMTHTQCTRVGLSELLARMGSATPLEPVDPRELAFLIQETTLLGVSLGFKLSRDSHAALALAHGIDPPARPFAVPFGKEGRVTYVAGPRDNPGAFIACLEESLGQGNFEVVMPL